jgi:MFS family permease
MGVAQSALQLGRFAAAEVNPPIERGRAISNVVLGGAVGAILGPLFVGPAGRVAQQAGQDELTGPYVVALALFAIAGLVIFIMLRPDPRDIGREIAKFYPTDVTTEGPARPLAEIFRQPAPLVALLSMIFGQLIMVLLMVITALHLKDHQHMLTDISLVISSHTFGMYAFSVFSGRLADRWGRGPVIFTGTVTLILACLSATLSPDVLPLAFALFLLGLGWNFCYVGGSSLLADHLLPLEKARAQGFNDLLIGLVSSIGSFSSGILFAALGYNLTGMLGAMFAIIPLGMVVWWMVSQRRLVMAK